MKILLTLADIRSNLSYDSKLQSSSARYFNNIHFTSAKQHNTNRIRQTQFEALHTFPPRAKTEKNRIPELQLEARRVRVLASTAAHGVQELVSTLRTRRTTGTEVQGKVPSSVTTMAM